MRISIVTVTYNDPEGLTRTLSSLSLFSGVSWLGEILIIDSSPTISGSIIARYSDVLPIRHVHAPREGIYAAMNAGWARAQEELLWFLNGGDAAGNKVDIDAAVKTFANDPSLAIYCGRVALTAQEQLRYWHPAPRSLWAGLRRGNSICHQGVIYRRALVAPLFPYRTEFRLTADFDLHLRAYSLGLSYFASRECIASFDTGGASANVDRVLREYGAVIKSHRPSFPKFVSLLLTFGWLIECARVKLLKSISSSPFRRVLEPIWIWWKRP